MGEYNEYTYQCWGEPISLMIFVNWKSRRNYYIVDILNE